MKLRIGYSAFLMVGLLACSAAIAEPAKPGVWIIESDRISTKGIVLSIQDEREGIVSKIGVPAETEARPGSFGDYYAGFLSLDYTDSTNRLKGISLALDFSLPGLKQMPTIPLSMEEVVVFGISIKPGMRYDQIAAVKGLENYTVISMVNDEEIGVSDGVHELWMLCLPDGSGLIYLVQYFKREDPKSI